MNELLLSEYSYIPLSLLISPDNNFISRNAAFIFTFTKYISNCDRKKMSCQNITHNLQLINGNQNLESSNR